jgi:hypothetical protein
MNMREVKLINCHVWWIVAAEMACKSGRAANGRELQELRK